MDNKIYCPLCGKPIEECVCYKDYGVFATARGRVVMEHLYFFSHMQVLHLIELQRKMHIFYTDLEKQLIYKELVEKNPYGNIED